MGVQPQLGRAFLAGDGQAGGRLVIMVSDALWHSRFGGDGNVIGQTLTLDAAPYTIVGVLPAGVQFPFIGPADVWSPRYFEHSLFTPQRLRTGVGYLTVVARLRPEVSRHRALAEMQVLQQQYRKENPGFPDADPGLSPVVTSSPNRSWPTSARDCCCFPQR